MPDLPFPAGATDAQKLTTSIRVIQQRPGSGEIQDQRGVDGVVGERHARETGDGIPAQEGLDDPAQRHLDAFWSLREVHHSQAVPCSLGGGSAAVFSALIMPERRLARAWHSP